MATTPKVAPKVAPEPAPEVAPTPPRSSRRRLWLLIGLLVVLSIGAALAYVFVLRDGKTAAPPVATKIQEKPIFMTLEPMTVNLQSEGGRAKFVHLGVVLKVRDEKAKAQIAEFMPELRSRILLLLSNRQPDSLMSPEDKSKLADEILAEFNRPLATGSPPQGVVGVSFNTFVVQ